MASERPPPEKTTGQTKRFKSHFALVQHVLRAQEALNRASASLTAAFQLLAEQEESEQEAPASPPPSMRPTRLEVPVMNAANFITNARKTWANAKTDTQRQQTRDLVTKGRSTGLIDEQQEAELLAEFQ